MSVSLLEKYLPPNCLPYLREWFGDYSIHIRVTRGRKSKLGDYRKLADQSHEISINATLAPELFFFVLTHELAHLIAFEKFGRHISPHGAEWKQTFRTMLTESLTLYSESLRPIIKEFAVSPKANFMSSPKLVRHFHISDREDDSSFIEDLEHGSKFCYSEEVYLLGEKRKKNYLCTHVSSGKKYIFKPLARVKKLS